MMQVLTPLPKIVLSSVRDTTGSLSLVAAEKVLLASSLGDVVSVPIIKFGVVNIINCVERNIETKY